LLSAVKVIRVHDTLTIFFHDDDDVDDDDNDDDH